MLTIQPNSASHPDPYDASHKPATTRSQRIVKALLHLPQFKPFTPADGNLYAVHVLSGAHVYPIESVQDLGLLLIRFSGSMPGAEVCGDQYLRLQICEAAGHLCRCPDHGVGVGAEGKAARDMLAELRLKYDLN